jgi:hypothetical protein
MLYAYFIAYFVLAGRSAILTSAQRTETTSQRWTAILHRYPRRNHERRTIRVKGMHKTCFTLFTFEAILVHREHCFRAFNVFTLEVSVVLVRDVVNLVPNIRELIVVEGFL